MTDTQIKNSSSSKKRNLVITFTLVFAGIGIFFLVRSLAATPNGQVEAENAVQSPAAIITDSQASGQKAIIFNKPTTGGGTLPFRASGNSDSLPGKLVFEDNFDGTSLNTSYWSTGWLGSGVTPPVQGQELACYDPAQVKVANGLLTLSAIAKTQTCGGKSRPYTSGAINSSGKKSYSYGYFEARIWLDEASGKVANWPAWWLDGKNWPTDGELDVMEGLSGSANATWHGPVNNGAGFSFGKGGARTGWHVFAANWQPGIVTSYYDGVKLGSYSSSTNITSAPQFLILGEQIGPEGQYGGPVKIPSRMDIDYVRVWQ